MGYKPKRQLVELDFSETEHAGLEVTTRKISVDALLGFVDLLEKADQLGGADLKPEDAKVVSDLFSRFAKVLVSWNVEDDDDQPVPATFEGIGTLDFDFVMEIITAWFVSVTAAPPPLKGASPNGAAPPEASLPMDVLPASPPSS